MKILFILLRFIFILQIIRSEHLKISPHDQQHYATMLRRMFSNRKNSSVRADCTLNLAIDGIYRIPNENSLSGQIIHLVEQSFAKEISAIDQTGEKIRANPQRSPWTLERFRDEFSLYLRILLSSQIRIKEIDVRFIAFENGLSSDLIKYSRKNSSSSTNFIDHQSIDEDILQQDFLLQTFSTANLRESINNDPQRLFNRNGWWLGPALCEKNLPEVYLMAYILPLINK